MGPTTTPFFSAGAKHAKAIHGFVFSFWVRADDCDDVRGMVKPFEGVRVAREERPVRSVEVERHRGETEVYARVHSTSHVQLGRAAESLRSQRWPRAAPCARSRASCRYPAAAGARRAAARVGDGAGMQVHWRDRPSRREDPRGAVRRGVRHRCVFVLLAEVIWFFQSASGGRRELLTRRRATGASRWGWCCRTCRRP